MTAIGGFNRVVPFVLISSLSLTGACSGGGNETSQPLPRTEAPAPATIGEPSHPGLIAIVAATASTNAEGAARVYDRNLESVWSSGTYAPGWIRLDLGQPTPITRVRLYTAQTPAGPTSHRLLGGPAPDGLTPLGTLDGDTADAQWLELVTKVSIRYLKIETTKSPSWVGWREIEIYGS